MEAHQQSFTARRSAASNLPTFQLPLPDLSGLPKFQQYIPPHNATQTAPQGISSVLTPPVTVPGEGASPISSNINSGSSQSSLTGIAPYNPGGYWPGPQPQQNNQQYSFNQQAPGPAPFQQGQQSSMYMGRQLYAPPATYSQQQSGDNRSQNENLPPPPYQLHLPPFPTNLAVGGSSGSQNHGPPTLQQQNQQHNSSAVRQNQQTDITNSMSHQSNSTQQNSAPPQDSFGPRPPPTPSYSYGSTGTPQRSTFPAFTQASSNQQSPATSGPPLHSISPVNNHHPSSMQPPHGAYGRPFGQYPLPAMPGPIMSNVHNPGNQMALVGGSPMYGSYGGQQVHGMYPQQAQQVANDKPFKCDQCVQSFNRNHDLKRHKKIHLAVKPHPCGHCEKSFSRKDALKRHKLVKGCGSKDDKAAKEKQATSPSVPRSEAMSDTTTESPEVLKREISAAT